MRRLRAAMLKRWHNGETGLNPVNPNPGYGPGERVAHNWQAHTRECPARAGSVYYCECGADPSRKRG